jgi:hypothetical protein
VASKKQFLYFFNNETLNKQIRTRWISSRCYFDSSDIEMDAILMPNLYESEKKIGSRKIICGQFRKNTDGLWF